MTRKQPENAEDLYARYFPLARATAARFLQGTGSDEDAEEVADDVMLELLAHPEKAEVMERSDDWCATAYWYWDRPAGGTEPLPELLERLA